MDMSLSELQELVMDRATSHLINMAGAQTMGFPKPKRKDLELSFSTQAISKQQSLRLWFQKPIKWNV